MFVLGRVIWILVTPSNLLTLLIVIGLLGALLRPGSRKPLVLAALGVLGLIVCGFSPLSAWLATPLEARFPPPRVMPAKVDGIVVLGGGLRVHDSAERGMLSTTEAGGRLIALADLARRYPAAKIVVSGGAGEILDSDDREADIVRRDASVLGIDPARILAEDRSRSTYENAVFSRDLAKPRDGETWLLVTSAWHMPRAVGAFRQAGFPVTAYPVDFRGLGPHGEWRVPDDLAHSLLFTDIMVKEWIGLAAYRAMGRTDALLPEPDPR
jgi:uncharacterized SAM-binding protein YcdF (DUF218 family)